MELKNAKLNYIKQGYSYIKCTADDCFDWGGMAICDDCGERMQDDVYLIFILARAYCPKCFENWIKRAKRYEDDIYLQKQRHLDWYKAYGFDVEEV